jgi:hypothetical protein
MSNKVIGTGGNGLAAYEPDPIANDNESIHDLVCDDLHFNTDPFSNKVIADLEERRRFGLEKYGTVLQSFNGRDALVDAYQEALDLLVYLKQELEESDDMDIYELYDDVSEVALSLRKKIHHER